MNKDKVTLVRRIAHQMIRSLPANIEIDDLIQVGMIGLLDAQMRFDAEHGGAAFETFASRRIRGAMLDELRRNDPMSRLSRRHHRRISTATNKLIHKLHRQPMESEIAAELGMLLPEYRKAVLISMIDVFNIEDMQAENEFDSDREVGFQPVDPALNPMEEFEDNTKRSALIAAIHDLPERWQQILSMMYEQDMSLKSIGAALGVTESRICQIHAQCIEKLKLRLRAF